MNYNVNDNDELARLREYLVLQTPGNDTGIPTDVVFTRSREISIDWSSVIGDDDKSKTPYKIGKGNEHWRYIFEKIWGVESYWLKEKDGEWSRKISEHDLQKIKRFRKSYTKKITIIKASDEGHEYVLRTEGENGYFEDSDFDGEDSYNKFWWKVSAIYASEDRGQEQDIEIVDLSPREIIRRLNRINSMREAARKIKYKSLETLERKIDRLETKEDVFDALNSYANMIEPDDSLDKEYQALSDQSRDLGYYLPMSPNPYTYPDGDELNVENGELFIPYRKVYRAKGVSQPTPIKKVLPHPLARPTYRVDRNLDLKDLKLKDGTRLNRDVLSMAEERLNLDGFASFKLKQSNGGYFTENNESLVDLLVRCQLDIEFWRKCAIWIPTYDEKLTQGDVLSGYIIIRRPLLGFTPAQLPRLFIEEEISLDISNAGVSVGELAYSVNLTPGERRTVTIERSITKDDEVSNSANSVVDVSLTDKVEFGSEFEKEARRSKDRTNSSNWSVKVGGSFGAASGAATAGGTSNTTTKQFAREARKYSQNAAQSVTRKTRLEVSSSRNTRASSTSSDSTVLEISNINDGSTLNLLFFQLYNIGSTAFRLRNMRLVIDTGIEDIHGTGITLPKEYLLNELDNFVESALLDDFPLVFSAAGPIESSVQYIGELSKSIALALAEYSSVSIKYDGEDIDTTKSICVKKECLETAITSTDSRVRYNALKKAVESISYTGCSINEEKVMILGSAGLYADSFVGVRPATEEFSEKMRRMEVKSKEAENSLISAKANWYVSAASRNAMVDIGFTAAGNSKSDKELKIDFYPKTKEGEWDIIVANKVVKTFYVRSDTDLTHVVDFEKAQSWLLSDASDVVKLRHRETLGELLFIV